MVTRRSAEPLLEDLGVEWLKPRSTSVTMGDILIGALAAVQTPSVSNARL
jgi:hypothetical protein